MYILFFTINPKLSKHLLLNLVKFQQYFVTSNNNDCFAEYLFVNDCPKR